MTEKICPDCNGLGIGQDYDTDIDMSLVCDYCDGSGRVGMGYSN
jgi:DnaJ-class molecular chaperone